MIENGEEKKERMIKIKERQVNVNLELCGICSDRIGEDEYVLKENWLCHKHCYHFVCCCYCRSKKDLHYEIVDGHYYCGDCFEYIKTTKQYKRMKGIEKTLKMYGKL